MSKITRMAVLVGLLTLTVLTGCRTTESVTRTGKRHVDPAEIRAIWVDTWNSGAYTAAQCDELLAWCRRYGFNTILLEVRKIGDAYYRSTLEPRGVNEATGEVIGDFDPLAYLIDTAPWMRIEAWIVANRIWKGASPPPRTEPDHIVRRFPDWLLVNRNGENSEVVDGAASWYLDPSEPGARAWVARVASEIAHRYPIDAIHLDYIRYPGNEWGYGDRSLARFRAQTGATGIPEPDDPVFTRWRADQVTLEVDEIRRSVRASRSRCDVTAAALTWGKIGGGYETTGGYLHGLQDWPSWLRGDHVDIVYPMHYRREHDPQWAADFRDWFPAMKRFRDASQSGRIVIGLGAYMNDVPATGRQARDALAEGFDGIAIFSYASPNRGRPMRAGLGRILADTLGRL